MSEENTKNEETEEDTELQGTGTCYSMRNCDGVLARDVTKTKCFRILNGYSWKASNGTCVNR